MGVLFYTIFLLFFNIGVRIATLFNAKAKKWLHGRVDIFERLRAAIPKGEQVIWIHCASLGEFEQGRPLLEKLKKQYPGHKILLTFFSPSGYEIRKDYKEADWVFYLPMDGSNNARRFYEIVNPSLAVFIKYEFWYFYLREAKRRSVPLLLVSAIFQERMPFFKWYGSLHRKMLSFFNHLFVQDEKSKKLLDKIGFGEKSTVNGDTRFDRVIEIAEKAESVAIVERFVRDHRAIIAGSTWPEDERILKQLLEKYQQHGLKLVIAPHEIHKEHINQLKDLFPGNVLYSDLLTSTQTQITSNILIIDNIGLLSRLYRYAFITYVGGGFGKGIHNTLEAAVYGKPLLFGPAYHKFREAIDLVKTGAAISIGNAEDSITAVERLLNNEAIYNGSAEAARNYVYESKGATERILLFIQENRLLTK